MVEVGALETGFLLGWIPATVSNDAAAGARGRQSAALFYLKTNDGHERSVYAPARHRRMVEAILTRCELRGALADAPPATELPGRTALAVDLEPGHNLAVVTVLVPGADLEEVVAAERHHLFHKGVDAVYVDLPLEQPATALVSEHLEALGVSFSGIFPNRRADGDVLRMQSLHRVRIDPGDVAVASDHGRELLDYVLADLPASG
jgi:serine/threonine-protein kinase RsbW